MQLLKKVRDNSTAATEVLWRAAETGDIEQAESILADGADINASNAYGMTALMRAASHGQVRMVRMLIEHGADPNTSRNDKFTPLLLAAFFGHEEIVRLLVEHGADVDAVSRFGTSAQMWASARTFPDVVHYLRKPRNSGRLIKTIAVEEVRPEARKQAEKPIAHERPRISQMTAVPHESSLAQPRPLNQRAETPIKDSTAVAESPDEFLREPVFVSAFEPVMGSVRVYAVAVLLVLAVFGAVMLWRRQQPAEHFQTRPAAAVEARSRVVSTKAAEPAPDSNEVKKTTPPEAQSDIHSVSSDVRTAFPIHLENKPKPPIITRDIASSVDSREPSASEKQSEVANVNQPEAAAVISAKAVNRELPPPATPKAKSEPTSTGNTNSKPAPLPTQLLAPSKASAAKSKVIQWP